MEKLARKKASGNTGQQSASANSTALLKTLFELSEDQILDKILEQDNPRQTVQQMPQEDFYWLVKKVGEDDCLPMLKISSDDQRQYLFDLEFWKKDRMDLEKTSTWFGRLHMVDPKGLVKWLFSKGETHAYYYLFKNIQVEIKDEDEDRYFEEDFFTLDDIFYVRILEEKRRETIENILRTMAGFDLDRYQILLSTLAGVIPTEMEEEMYRLRNIRLAEHGFLPPEEALAVYAPLDPDALSVEVHAADAKIAFDEEIRELVPISPFYHAQRKNILTKTFSKINDNVFRDGIRLEFAGLCNQILSADGILANELDSLIRTCRKAARHLNLALEKLCGTDISLAEELLKNNSLVSIFRVGFGLVLGLKWETNRWLKNSWFYGQGLGFSFWGDRWGETLSGIMENKPRLYTGFEEEEEFRNFEQLSELDDCRRLIYRLKALDRILGRLTELYPLDKSVLEHPQLTIHQCLFNLWARLTLNLKPGFSSMSTDQAKEFFSHLRTGEKAPPFRMSGFEEVFLNFYKAYASDFDPESEATLNDTLSLIWHEFAEEYEWVATGDLEGRFTKFIATDSAIS
ncbi:MAG: hypothetical protein JRJ15_01635 [Deltaproteobacteria bacterium]|nr:hypothetical protein [Deltaproteobacteria bacterium]